MTTMYEPTGAQVLRSRSWTSEQGDLAQEPPPDDIRSGHGIWSSTFMETSSSLWLRSTAEHFSDALDARHDEHVYVAIMKHCNGRVDLPDSYLWLAGPHSIIAGVQRWDQEPDPIANETADAVDAFERIRAELGLTQKEMFKATGINKRTFHSWTEKPAGTRPRVASLGRLWELADAVEDLRDTLDQPLSRWLRGDKKRISALLDGRFDELVDLAVDRSPFSRREIGTSVYEGIAEYVETPIIRTGGPLVAEDVEDGFAR
ncbi:hypothetical protein PXH69_31440 [Rhodococcus qingshengii]|uniref:Helix-turn-helix transcriptional regulator n=1 Tax=Rhodococcus qingshengii TaxID=334542 RepID=A0AAW6LW80_RHOSG|nr:hypothetical protein [Rhodococcus qingshengii]MDE8649491.1 hypothetical protein [Rhodococcus qingshengii]